MAHFSSKSKRQMKLVRLDAGALWLSDEAPDQPLFDFPASTFTTFCILF